MEKLLSAKGIYKKFSINIRRGIINHWLNMFQTESRLKLNPSEFWAIQDISLDLNRGEVVGIIGPNGSGKTTLMRILSGIYQMDAGTVEIHGSVATIFALKAGMHPHFTGRENAYIKASMYGLSRKEIDKRMDFIIDFSELESSIDSPIGMYSSGMRARLAFAVGMAVKPDIFIIDEGLAVGDHSFREKSFEYLRTQKQHMGVLFVSNSPGKITAVSDRCMILKSGKIIHESHDVQAAMRYYTQDIAPITKMPQLNINDKHDS